METVNWLLGIWFFISIAIIFGLNFAIMALLEKRDSLKKESILLSEENKMLVKENEKLCNHIFILKEVDMKSIKEPQPMKVKLQKK